MPQREHQPNRNGPFSLLHQLPGHVVDCRDMVGIHCMPQPKAVGEKRRTKQHRKVPERYRGPHPGCNIACYQKDVNRSDLTDRVAATIAKQGPQSRNRSPGTRTTWIEHFFTVLQKNLQPQRSSVFL